MDTQWLYHILPQKLWEKAQKHGQYCPESLEVEGFIHFSIHRQVLTVAEKFYKGQAGLCLLKVDPDKLKATLKFDHVAEMADRFPHLYGPLNIDAVINCTPFEAAGDGQFVFDDK